MKTLSINRRLRTMKRISEIVGVLMRYGFADVVQSLSLTRLPGAHPVPETGANPVEGTPRHVRLRQTLEELGPTFIKLGQVLSTRPDLVPAEWAEEFKQLQTNCPKIYFSEIQGVLEREFPGRVNRLFASIPPEPLAAGSMAQVHRAMLATGEPVVVKVLRPG